MSKSMPRNGRRRPGCIVTKLRNRLMRRRIRLLSDSSRKVIWRCFCQRIMDGLGPRLTSMRHTTFYEKMRLIDSEVDEIGCWLGFQKWRNGQLTWRVIPGPRRRREIIRLILRMGWGGIILRVGGKRPQLRPQGN